jgi:arylformamidase
MKLGRIIELSHPLIPSKEHFKLEVKNFDVTEVLPHVKHSRNVWYILSEVTFCSHVGTHIEFPYHHLKNGLDAYRFPLKKLVGEGVVLNFSHKKANEAITLDELKAYDKNIKTGDIVLIRTDFDRFFYTDHWEDQPYIDPKGIKWLIDKGISCLGTDAPGLEVPGTDYQPNHTILFQNNIPMIESMTNLSSLTKERFIIVILPLPLEGSDASPVRIVAIE